VTSLTPDRLRPTIEQCLRQLQDPWSGVSLQQTLDIESASVEGQHLSLVLAVAYPCNGGLQAIRTALEAALLRLDPVEQVSMTFNTRVRPAGSRCTQPALQQVRNIIAVASGKGGVGKSTTAVNLALALRDEGASVGILDADIYGPSVGRMLGVKEGQRPGSLKTPDSPHPFFRPLEALGLASNSMAYLVTENTPMVWRGPMASGALLQLLEQTWWGELDYLIVDMPPGTGDVQLTLSQKVPLAGSLIITTPQDLALQDARKGIEMFRKVRVPVLGIVENMSLHRCSQCGHTEPVFGEGGGQQLAQDADTCLLGSLPLSLRIREQVDCGLPSVQARHDQPERHTADAQLYLAIARRLAARLASLTHNRPPVITSVDD